MPSPKSLVARLCKTIGVGDVFEAGALQKLEILTNRGVHYDKASQMAAIALYMQAFQDGRVDLFDVIAREAKITPQILARLIDETRNKMRFLI